LPIRLRSGQFPSVGPMSFRLSLRLPLLQRSRDYYGVATALKLRLLSLVPSAHTIFIYGVTLLVGP
ncbi:hypothetical protein Bpfe_023934, partial [Biomphalaria pfeifferi]